MQNKIITLIDGVSREDWFLIDGELLSYPDMLNYLEKNHLVNGDDWEYLQMLDVIERFWQKEAPYMDSEEWKKRVLAEYKK